jgi:superfamily I DNA/RNA helicase
MSDLIKTHKLNSDQGVDLSTLDETQAAAVTSTAEKIILRAPAGSGKTTSIINAIVQYRYENLNDRICAITYTRAARAEMEARLQEKGVYDVEVTTIHV